MILVRGIVGGPYHPPLWRCHSTDAKQAKCNRGAPYIYWGYSRWALASTIVALSQHESKAGSNDIPVNGKSSAHAGPESTKTAAEDCRCEGCIRHRLTLAHQDRPKPQQGQVARGGWSSMGKSKGKSDDRSQQVLQVGLIIHLCGVVTARTQSRQSVTEGRPTYTGGRVGGP